MKISFHGAARTVTGSKHLIHLDSGAQILLDCGMFQGLGKETLQLNSNWGFDPAAVTYVILSHAHIDHVGLLPKLVRDGFKGKIFCTPPTADLAAVLMLDSARIQEYDVEHINEQRRAQGRELITPLYTEDDAQKVIEQFVPVDYNEPVPIDKDVELLYTDCGHLLGSAAIHLKINERDKNTRLTFSGDIGRYRDVILRSPETFPQADYIIMESTYGNSLHELAAPTADKLRKIIKHTCEEKRGNLIIPAFSVGRTQEILYLLNRLDLERRLPEVPYYVDSPLSVRATEIIKHHPECFNEQVQEVMKRDDDVFAFKGLEYLVTSEQSRGLNERHEPCVIISASGMAEAGRVKHHIAHGIGNRHNTILLVGYCEPHSLGGRLKAGDKEVSIFGKPFDVVAEVESLTSMSAHGDYDDMLHWLSCQDHTEVKQLFLVHGEYEVQQAFRERIIRKGFEDVLIPEQHQEVEIG